MAIRYYIDPATGLPHIYEHGISESEVEEILDNPTQDLRGQNYRGSQLAKQRLDAFLR